MHWTHGNYMATEQKYDLNYLRWYIFCTENQNINKKRRKNPGKNQPSTSRTRVDNWKYKRRNQQTLRFASIEEKQNGWIKHNSCNSKTPGAKKKQKQLKFLLWTGQWFAKLPRTYRNKEVCRKIFWRAHQMKIERRWTPWVSTPKETNDQLPVFSPLLA